MTSPADVQAPIPAVPQAVGAVEQTKDQADRLGLTWQMRQATVYSIANPAAAWITFDGDTQPVPAVIMQGPIIATDRVYVIAGVAPQGNYIVGLAGAGSGRSRLVAHAESILSSAAIGAETVVLTTNSMIFRTGRAYLVKWLGRLESSVAQTTILRVRKTDVVGQALHGWSEDVVAGALRRERSYDIFVRNTGTVDVVAPVALTLQSTTGTTTQVASSTAPRWMTIEDYGGADDYPAAIVIL